MKKALSLLIVAFVLTLASCGVSFNVEDTASAADNADNYGKIIYNAGQIAEIYDGDKLCAEMAFYGYEVKKQSYSRERTTGIDENGEIVYETVNYSYIVDIDLVYTLKSGFKKEVEKDDFAIASCAGEAFIISVGNDGLTVALDALVPFNLEYSHRALGSAGAVFAVDIYMTETSDGSLVDFELPSIKASELAAVATKTVRKIFITVAVVGVVLLVGVVIFLVIYSRLQKKKRENGVISQYQPGAQSGVQLGGNYVYPARGGSAAPTDSANGEAVKAPDKNVNPAQSDNNADNAQSEDFFTE